MAGVVWNCCFDLDHGFGKGWGKILDFKVPSSFKRCCSWSSKSEIWCTCCSDLTFGSLVFCSPSSCVVPSVCQGRSLRRKWETSPPKKLRFSSHDRVRLKQRESCILAFHLVELHAALPLTDTLTRNQATKPLNQFAICKK